MTNRTEPRSVQVGRETLTAEPDEYGLVDVYISDPVDGRHCYATLTPGDPNDIDNLARNLTARYGRNWVAYILEALGLEPAAGSEPAEEPEPAADGPVVPVSYGPDGEYTDNVDIDDLEASAAYLDRLAQTAGPGWVREPGNGDPITRASFRSDGDTGIDPGELIGAPRGWDIAETGVPAAPEPEPTTDPNIPGAIYTRYMATGPAAGHPDGPRGILAVATMERVHVSASRPGVWAAYIGPADSETDPADIGRVLGQGYKMPEPMARALFAYPELETAYYRN